MRQIREILRLKHDQGLRHRAIARACGVGVGTVSQYLERAQRAGLGWPLPPELDEAALEARLSPAQTPGREWVAPSARVMGEPVAPLPRSRSTPLPSSAQG